MQPNLSGFNHFSTKHSALVFISVVILLPLSASAQPVPRAVPVEITLAESIVMAPVSWLPGTVVSRDDARIAAEVEGVLRFVAEVGDSVAQGEEIARLDPIILQLDVAEAQAAIAPIETRIRYYAREMERLRTLTERSNVAESMLDEMRANRDEAEGQLQVARARLALLEDRLGRTSIKAPFAGVVEARYQYPGERVAAGDPILRLVNTARLEIQVRVPVDSFRQVSMDDELRVTDRNVETVANVRAVVPVGDDISRLHELRLQFSQPDWLAGHPVRVAVPTAAPRETIAIHRDALVIRRDEVMVFRIDDDEQAELLSITTGIAVGDWVEVHGNIHAGDRIVVRGNERLQPGQRVMILNAAEPG